jgi:hypothetical protein
MRPSGASGRSINAYNKSLGNMRAIFWILASVCLGSGLLAPAATNQAPGKAPVKGKAAITKAPARPAAAAAAPRSTVSTATTRPPAKGSSGAPVAAPVRRPQAPTASTHRAPARGVQPQNTRYNSNARRPQVAARRGYVRPRVYVPPVQMQPTQERHREIQQALVQKGYLHTDPSGNWDAESADAMKRFQRDQNLEADGKISSLSLIALGLGPKRVASASAGAPSTAPPQPPPPSAVPPIPQQRP